MKKSNTGILGVTKSFGGKRNGQETKGKNAAAKLTSGLDRGDKTSCYCALDSQGELIEEGSVPTNKKGRWRRSELGNVV